MYPTYSIFPPTYNIKKYLAGANLQLRQAGACGDMRQRKSVRLARRFKNILKFGRPKPFLFTLWVMNTTPEISENQICNDGTRNKNHSRI